MRWHLKIIAVLSKNSFHSETPYVTIPVHKPTLLIWGKDDQTLPFAHSPRVAKALNVKTFVVEDAGHISHFERPEIVNPKLLNFLKAL